MMTKTEALLLAALDDYIDARIELKDPRADFNESIRVRELRDDLMAALRAFRSR